MEAQSTDYFKIVLISTGDGWLDDERSRIAIAEGDVLLIRPGLRHRLLDRAEAPLSLWMACFSAPACRRVQGLEPLLEKTAEVAKPTLSIDYQSFSRARKLLQRMLFEQTQGAPEHGLVLVTRLAELIVVLSRGTARSRRRPPAARAAPGIVASLDYIAEHFVDAIAVGDLARLAGMSYRRFTGHFRRHTGDSVVSYILKLRVTYAQQRLRETGAILASALDAGFEDLSHFYRIFRRHTGTTPRRFLLRLPDRQPA